MLICGSSGRRREVQEITVTFALPCPLWGAFNIRIAPWRGMAAPPHKGFCRTVTSSPPQRARSSANHGQFLQPGWPVEKNNMIFHILGQVWCKKLYLAMLPHVQVWGVTDFWTFFVLQNSLGSPFWSVRTSVRQPISICKFISMEASFSLLCFCAAQ